MATTKRTIKLTVEINGRPTIFAVYPEGTTFQGYQKYLVCDNDGHNIHRYQTDATTKREIVSYLENVLSTLFYNGTLKNSPSNWCGF
jgi:hypothetical protein